MQPSLTYQLAASALGTGNSCCIVLRHPPALGRDTPCPALPCPAPIPVSSRSPFLLESQHIDETGKPKRPRLRPTTPWPMEEEAEKEEKTQQHAVAMVLEQSEGEGRGQDPATL